ncbi:helix-turn-helix domain-containing protein [Xanthobacter sp. V13C-7B]|uniref:MarR family transcriptional regulator n=1 Tax=Xanthobacter variabilis TaxID=3119932 RepID=UPI003728BA2A
MNIIYTMTKNGEPVTVTKLCERLDTPRQVVVDVLKALVERELLSYTTAVPDSGRGRVYVYALTEKALTL